MSDHTAARAFIREYASEDFEARILERIAEQDERLDCSYQWASLRAFQRKLREELADVGGYSALISTRTGDDRRAGPAGARRRDHRLAAELQRLLAREVAA